MRKSLYFWLFAFVLITIIVTFLCSPTAPIVFVSANGDGDYNCDGVSDQVQINAALAYASANGIGTVYLKNSASQVDFIVDDQIQIPSNIHFTGDKGVQVNLKANLTLPVSSWPWVTGTSTVAGHPYKESSNVEISNITFDADRWNQANIPNDMMDEIPTISIRGNNLEFHDLSFPTGLGDFIKIPNYGEKLPGINIHNNSFGRSGHCGVYILYTGATDDSRIWIHDNDFWYVSANTGVRLDECSGALIENNTFTSFNQGDHAIYLTYKNDECNIGSYDNEIRYNTIHGVREYGILLTALVSDGIVDKAETTGNHIHHNLIYSTLWDGNGGGISVYGFDDVLIESNTIVGCEGDGISTKKYLLPLVTDGFTITARNNIITGMIEASGHGYGINNILSTQHTIVSDYNNIYNNALGNYNNVAEGANDIHSNPYFYDMPNGNYHLNSTFGTWTGTSWEIMDTNSPSISAGHITSDYSNEPESNGNRINIGRYGNTAEASMSADEIKPTSAGDTNSTPDTIYSIATIDDDLNEWQNTTGIEMHGASDRSTESGLALDFSSTE